MRKIILVFLILFSLNLKANCVNDFDWSRVYNAIIQVESKGNEKAVSKNGLHCGVLQITPILVKDVNQYVGYNKFTLNDRFNAEKSIEMFILIQKRYNPSNDVEKAIRIWNGGPNYSISKTQNYYKTVMNVYNKTQD